RALRALRHVELDALVLLQRAEALRLDRGVVREHVGRAVLGGDEAVALLAVEPLHGSGSHCYSFKSVETPPAGAGEYITVFVVNSWVTRSAGRPPRGRSRRREDKRGTAISETTVQGMPGLGHGPFPSRVGSPAGRGEPRRSAPERRDLHDGDDAPPVRLPALGGERLGPLAEHRLQHRP